MDKNTLSGLGLMALVIFLFMWLNKPSQEQIEAQRQAQSAAAAQASETKAQAPVIPLVSADEASALAKIIQSQGQEMADKPGCYKLQTADVDLTVDTRDGQSLVEGVVKVGGIAVPVEKVLSNDLLDITPEQADQAHTAVKSLVNRYLKYKSFASSFYGKDETFTLENDQMRVTFANKGGMIQEVVLKDYRTETTKPATDVTLFTAETGSYRFAFVTADQRIYTDSLYFTPTEVTDSSVVMSLDLGKDIAWQIKYTMVPGDYVVKMDILQQGVSAVIPPSTTTLGFDWRQRMVRNELGRTFEERNSALTYKFVGEGPEEMSANSAKSEKLNGSIKWVAFKNQFFSSVVIARQAFTSADVSTDPIKDSSKYLKDMSLSASLPYNTADGCPASFDFYFGPNLYPLLSDLDDKLAVGDDLQLNRLVPLGWGLFRWINQLIVIPVFHFLGKYIHNYGIIILLLTIFIKIILFPFTYKSYRSQAKMRVLAPEIKEINDKYPGQENAMKRQQETMALYSRAGASPFSGCLPLLLQMPILIAMFAFFPSAIELRGQSFLWAHDLSAPDSILTLPFSIPFYGNHVSLFCLLMTVVNIVYSKINMQAQPSSSSMPGMKWMMYLMPVMFLFIFNDYASGLSYYYFLSLLITILQTYAFRFIIDDKKVRAEMLENAKKPKKKGGFMARLEEAQKKQEAYMRQQSREQAKKRK